jgi:putative ABC transport system permease protein
MIKNYLKIGWRNLSKNKVFSFINISGLAIGMACSLLMWVYVKHELSYDTHIPNADRIYRVVKDFVNADGSRIPDATTPPALAPVIQAEVPEIESATRVFPGWSNKFLIKYGEKRLYEERLFRVDSNFFDFFNLHFVKGSAQTVFQEINNIVLTEPMADKYFGETDPMGQILEVANLGSLKVTGVVKEMPQESHFHADFLISTRKFGGDINEVWDWYNFYTYIKLKPNTAISTVEPKIAAVFKKNNPENQNVYYTQALTDIHLNSQLKWEIEPNGDGHYVDMIGIIALVVLLIAMLNYINLSTAKSALRAREVGVRKVVGAARKSLINQFLTESVLVSLLAGGLAIGLAQLFLPVINRLTEKELVLASTQNGGFLLAFGGLVLVVGILAGIIPALYLSAFQPVAAVKNLKVNQSGALALRKSFVVVQFTLSVTLIVGALIVGRQIDFIQNTNLGFNKEQVLMVGGIERSNIVPLTHAFKELPDVLKVSPASFALGGLTATTPMRYKGGENEQLLNFISVGHDYLDLMGIEMKEGRDFSAEFPADTTNFNANPNATERKIGSIILNEKAVQALNIPEPVLGKEIIRFKEQDTTYTMKIVGVVKDFHYTSLRNEIKPFAFVNDPRRFGSMVVKLGTNDVQNTLSQIEKTWNRLEPRHPFSYEFLDERFAKLYSTERQFNTVFSWLTILGIVIACLGLLALSIFTAEQRVKEIGIRKVLGASVLNITGLMSKDFLKLVLIANGIAFPIAYYFMQKWLADFAYRIDMQWWMFALAGAGALLIAFLTVGFQSVKAALANPVKSLRSE